jgi:hypothetical protein
LKIAVAEVHAVEHCLMHFLPVPVVQAVFVRRPAVVCGVCSVVISWHERLSTENYVGQQVSVRTNSRKCVNFKTS